MSTPSPMTIPSLSDIAKRMWPYVWAGYIVLGFLLANLFLITSLFPTRYVDGVVCTCGRPWWVTYWALGIYALLALVGVLIIYGVVVDRRLHRVRTR
jgi:hypothetical protein